MANQLPTPGTLVPSATRVSPGGARGIIGLPGMPGARGETGASGEPGPPPTTVTINSIAYVPPVGGNVTVQVADARWIIPGQTVYLEGAGGDGVAGALTAVGVNGNRVTLLNPEPPTTAVMLIAQDEAEAQTLSAANPEALVFYPEA